MGLFRHRATVYFQHEREKRPVPIVGDAAIGAGRLADGRMVPLLIVDTSSRPELDELIRVHEHLPPGDVDSTWAPVDGSDRRVALILSFKSPVKTVALLEFDIVEQGILVDQIAAAKLFYLQAGRAGDRFVTSMNAPRIFVEVAATGFREHWDKHFHKQLAKHFRGEGLGRHQAKEAAKQAIKEMRRVGKLRMPAR